MDIAAKRQIRVFISSTFEDMKEEREYLIKKIFPEMRQKAYERNVSLVEVDLRWGITEEDAKKGKIVDICLDEIDNSIPFFIGIIGNRYGWCPESKDISLSECRHHDFITKYINRHLSVTEMEILYAALDRTQPVYASFYINSNKGDENRIDAPKKLNELKESIRNNNRYPYFNYFTKEDLGEKVKLYFSELLNKLFPEEEHLSETDLIIHSQTLYRNSLCSSYIADNDRFEAINTLINNKNIKQLVIIGDSGVGKSAFTAEWVRTNQQNHEIIYYSVGVGGNNSDKDTVLSQLSLLINNKYNVYPDGNIKSFGELIDAISDRPLIIVIDAFNQINLKENEESLDWFPTPTGNIKFIITTTSDNNSLYSNTQHINTRLFLSRRDNSQEYLFKNFSASIREKIINKELKRHGKNIDPIFLDKIINSELFNNCLALRILLNELIISPNSKTVEQTINKSLSYNEIYSYINSVLKRYEQDYGQLLVRKALTLLAISEHGFNEAELKDMINAELATDPNGSTITQIQWSQFYCAFKDNLSTRECGLFGFAHQLVRTTILEKYVSEKDSFTTALRYLIINTLKEDKTPRAYSELAYQYLCLKDYENLLKVISSPNAFYCLMKDNWGKFSEYWIQLCVYSEGNYPLSEITNAWQKLNNEQKAETYNKVELLLASIIIEQQGFWPPASYPIEFIYMQEQCIPFQTTIYGIYHYAYSAGAAYMLIPEKKDKALELLLKATEILEKSDPQEWDDYYEKLKECYYSIAHLYNSYGSPNEEIYYLERYINPCEKHYGEYNINTLKANFIVGFQKYSNNDFWGAIPNFEKSLKIAEKLEDIDNIYQSCTGLVECYSGIFKKEQLENKYEFHNQTNILKYIIYNEKLASVLKDSEDIDQYKKVINHINEIKSKLNLD